MGRGKRLTAREMGAISALAEQGYSHEYIADKLKRSQNVVSTYLRDPQAYTKNKFCGRPPKLRKSDLRLIKRATKSDSSSTSHQLVQKLQLDVSPETVRRALHKSGLRYAKRKPAPRLNAKNKEKRVAFAKQYIHYTAGDWCKVVFSDEKAFNLDGPDVSQFHWYDKSIGPELYSVRKFKGGGLSVWGAITFAGTIAIVPYEGRFKSEDYIRFLKESEVFENAEAKLGLNYIFQQDNASQHTSAETRSFLEKRGVQVLDFPATSPDLNPIENIWAYMARHLYEGGKQFTDKKELKSAIVKLWKNIPRKVLESLYQSMPERILQVLMKHGNFVGY